jgi:hypothetical protein
MGMSYDIILKRPPRFRDVTQFTRQPTYTVDVSWCFLKRQLEDHGDYELDLDPDFQRGHVWDSAKQTAYIEFSLRGGTSAQNIYFNCPGWHAGHRGDYVLVDGKQRLTAVLAFLDDKVPVFGGYLFSDFADKLRMTVPSFRWHVNDLRTRAEVLQWYLDLNTGGVVHTGEEIKRVQALLAKERG